MTSLRTATICVLAFGYVGFHAEAAWAQYGQLRPHLTLTPGTSGPKRGVGPNADTVTIVPIMWTKPGTDGCGGPDYPTVTEAQLGNFYTAVAYSTYYGWIQQQYNTALALSVAPARQLFINSTTAPDSDTATCPNPTSQVIESILRAEISGGFLPRDANGNTSTMVYAIHFPKNLSSRVPYGSGFLCDGTNACAYNGATTFNNQVVSYYVIPDMTNDACATNCDSSGTGPLDNLTVSESHELIETLTDPGPFDNGGGQGWENRTQSCACTNTSQGPVCLPCTKCTAPTCVFTQIGDLCAQTPARGSVIPGGATAVITAGRTFTTTVQKMWSNVANACEDAQPGAPASTPTTFDPSSRPDPQSSIVLAGMSNGEVDIAVSNGTTSGSGSGTFSTVFAATFDDAPQCPNCWSSLAQAQNAPHRFIVSGDFNGDGFGDLAITGPSDWTTIPIATATPGNPSQWHAMNSGIVAWPAPIGLGQAFPFWAAASRTDLPPVTGDFNGDGLTDIAVAGGPGWESIPIAFAAADGQGHWWSTNNGDNGFNAYIAQATGGLPDFVAADFNGDGLSDLALFGLQYGSPPFPVDFIVVALSNGDGTFGTPIRVPTAFAGGAPVSDFNVWATQSMAIAGDFNGDGLGDIALTGGPGWASIPIAFGNSGSLGKGFIASPGKLTSFVIVNVLNDASAQFNSFSSQVGTEQLVAGDFNGDGVTDLALTGGTNWSSIPIAFSMGASPSAMGWFAVTDVTTSDLAGFSQDGSDGTVVANSASRFAKHGF